MKRWLMCVASGIAAILVLSSCAGTPTRSSQPETESREVPDWVKSAPDDTQEYVYFVGYASDPEGNQARAEEQATYAMISEITRYIGVQVTSETTAEAKASLDDFQSSVTQEVRQTSDSRVTGFRIADKWVSGGGGEVTVYLLGRYNREDLMKEKRRLEEVFQAKIDAVAVPEQEGRDLEGRGRYFQAIRRYIQAAVAAANSEVDNADILFQRNIDNAKRVIGSISLIKLNDNLQVYSGQSFDEDFGVKLVYGSDLEAPGIPAADVRVSYRVLRSNGRMGVASEVLQTDPEGYLTFTHPVPEFVGTAQLTMALEIEGYLEPLYDVESPFQAQVDSLEDLALDKRVTFRYEVVSNAKNIPTALSIIDLDSAGNPTGKRETASSVMDGLSSADFKVRLAGAPDAMILSGGRTAVEREVLTRFGNEVRRLAYGTARIDEFEERDGNFFVKVRGEVTVTELETGEVIASVNRTKRSRGTNVGSAISAAFRGLGQEIGKELVNSLP